MNDQPRSSGFDLDADIVVADKLIHPAGTRITVRKPQAGELRGVDITALTSRCDYAQVELLGPRVTNPRLEKADIAAMDPADLVQLGGELIDFLLPKAVKQAAFPDA